MKEFQGKIKLFEKTGDLNLDFLKQILAYEQMGIELGKSELQFGANNTLKESTHESIKVMKREVKEIEKLLKHMVDEPVVDELKESEYLELYQASYDELILSLQHDYEEETIKGIGCIDRDFLNKFLPYLGFKLELINHIIEKSENEDVKKLAIDFKEQTQKELETFKKIEESIK